MQQVGVQQVRGAQADAVDLVGVGRTDAPAGRPDALLAGEALGDLVEGLVVRGDQMSVCADQRVIDDHPALGESVEFVVHDLRIDDYTVTDDSGGVAIQDARREQVHDELLASDHHGVTGVVTPRVAHDVVDLLAESVDCLTLALVAPLGAQNDDARHVCIPSCSFRRFTPEHSEAPCSTCSARGLLPPHSSCTPRHEPTRLTVWPCHTAGSCCQ
ncbi:hypothetical protein SDC9_172006 [bioreactor metagenome]|uniref:Uncharacterized protein n=1 Tax=bioreactor metagenome TaxID=1076179 RepID=A0A645GD47_9ZZZZ